MHDLAWGEDKGAAGIYSARVGGERILLHGLYRYSSQGDLLSNSRLFAGISGRASRSSSTQGGDSL